MCHANPHLSYFRVKVVHDHMHHGRRLPAASWIHLQGIGPHDEGGTKPIHVDVPIVTQLTGELRCQSGVEVGREVAQSILQGQL